MTFEELGIKTQAGKVRYSTLCPKCSHLRQHHKTTPCLTVNNEEGNRWFKCFHCNWMGNIEVLDKYNQVQEKSRMPKQIASTYSKEVREYWDKRGIDTKHPLADKVFEFVMAGKPIIGFPTYMSLTLVDVKYLDIRWQKGQDSPKWWNMKKDLGTRTLPWGIDKINFEEGEKKIVLWTEGHVDRLTWIQCGYKNILSVPSGAPSTKAENFDKEFDYLNDPYTKSVLADVELHILCTDNDEAGIKLRNHMALILGKDKCKYVNYPIGYKDSNEVYKGVNKEEKKLAPLGKQGIDDLYKSLASFPLRGIIRPQDVKEELEMIASNGFTPGYGIGIKDVDNLFTLKRKQFTVVTGLPSSGKSVWVRWYLSEFVRHNDKEEVKWALFTPENRPVSREQARMAEVITGQSFRRGFKNSMSEDLRARTMRYIQKHFFFIAPSKLNFETWKGKIDADRVNSMESLMQYLITLKKTEDIFGFVIDAWNKIEHDQPKNQTETTFISKQLDHLINFCDVYDLHCILIAHPTKIEKVGINYRLPCLYDIKGSSAWKEKADLGLILHRYMYKKKKAEDIPDDPSEDDKIMIDSEAPTILVNEKVRFEECGKLGKIKMKMDFAKGGRFVIVDECRKPPVPEAPGKLNPKSKEDEDDVFSNNGKQGDDLPF